MRRQRNWSADDAWLRPGLEIAFAIPTSQTSGYYGVNDFCQVCARPQRRLFPPRSQRAKHIFEQQRQRLQSHRFAARDRERIAGRDRPISLISSAQFVKEPHDAGIAQAGAGDEQRPLRQDRAEIRYERRGECAELLDVGLTDDENVGAAGIAVNFPDEFFRHGLGKIWSEDERMTGVQLLRGGLEQSVTVRGDNAGKQRDRGQMLWRGLHAAGKVEQFQQAREK